jgi:predicted transcriptional regulator
LRGDGAILVTGRLERPQDGHVADNGTFILNDWMFGDGLNSRLCAFRADGQKLLEREFSANLGTSGISSDGRFAICQTAHAPGSPDSNRHFLFDLEEGQEIATWVQETGWTNSYEIDSANRIKHTFRLPPDLSRQLAEVAILKRTTQASIVEAAIASFLSPDGSERMEAAVTRRLDRLTKQNERLEFQIEVTNEALALFVRFWLTANAPLPDSAMAAAQAQGKQRYEGFVEAVARKLESAHRFTNEVRHGAG